MKKAILGLSLLFVALSANAARVSGITSYDLNAGDASFNVTSTSGAQFFEFGSIGPGSIAINFSGVAGGGGLFSIFEDIDGALNGSGDWLNSNNPLLTFRINGANPLASFTLAAGTYVLRLSGTGNSGATTAVTLAAVPVPAAAWLFGSALVGIGAIRRKKQAMFA